MPTGKRIIDSNFYRSPHGAVSLHYDLNQMLQDTDPNDARVSTHEQQTFARLYLNCLRSTVGEAALRGNSNRDTFAALDGKWIKYSPQFSK